MLEENVIKSRFLNELEYAEEKARVVKEELPELKQRLRTFYKETREALSQIDDTQHLKYISRQEADKLLMEVAQEEIRKVGEHYGVEFSKGDIASMLF